MFWDGFHADLGGSIFYEQRDSEISAPTNAPTADYDNDELANGLEYIQNLNPTDADNATHPLSELGLNISHDLELSWRQQSGGSGTIGIDYAWQGAVIALELSTDNLETWVPATGADINTVSTIRNSDGTDRVTVRMLSPLTDQQHFSWRYRIDIQE